MSHKYHTERRPVVLCIMDGWGYRTDCTNNAIALADTPSVNALLSRWPSSLINAAGKFVGLPDGQIGNSEVGHINIGAGRIVMQDLPKINLAIKDGSLVKQPAISRLCDALKNSGGTCHLMGLVSNGGVHSHYSHVVALAKIISATGAKVVIHVFTDGRDCFPKSALNQLRTFINDLDGVANIASVSGRFFAMDRDNHWDRIEQSWKAVCLADAKRSADDAVSALQQAYDQEESDEFITPTVIDGGIPVQNGDALVMLNFRADRSREILAPFVDENFDGFSRSRIPKLCIVVGMVQYSSTLASKMVTIFPPTNIPNTLGEVVANAGKTQLRIAETEKYPHVTFFLNGGREEIFDGEKRIIVPSPKVKTYDLQPEMSALELCNKLVSAIDANTYDLIVANFANPDMVGHTGCLNAAIKAVETVDTCIGRVAEVVLKVAGVMFLTADHGNCEIMVDPETGINHTTHTNNLVPAILVGAPENIAYLNNGILADVAPTLLALIGIEHPAAMTGKSMLLYKH
ncbi:2,3-bisphosphoglycerate-independent phosphoglycerate mutase [Candidatus Endolissoclinum faulkneri L2]|uniref:2,3-bisphosphoglycerate-independent phosphoglycerate mutase n=1 Tax=Candidatus Endolissoclinum faulkneri L2 TaxID=1193729 RepID=K7ZCT8_9PROT|nr:2,3-bisphosphoglycerate-independent phosphoglycerate mutase [Candidatus Endolissoclinum faulkneri]AFX98896.1 2,3-bisphosphoglycerate-independent phosphoglycerate mutase [Candidatus Endolissoclinum faulkneri L2]